MKQRLPLLIILLLLLLFSGLAVEQQPKHYFPTLRIETPAAMEQLTLNFLFERQPTLEHCETLIGRVSRVMLEACPHCKTQQVHCLSTISTEQHAMLSSGPLPVPSGRMANGVVLFQGASSSIAQESCQLTERQTATTASPVQCFSANTPRPIHLRDQSPTTIYQPLLIVLFAFCASCLVVWLILKYEHLHAHLSHDHTDAGPQKYHEFPTPRIGGIAIMSGLLVSGGLILLLDIPLIAREFGLLLLASAPAFLGGLVEDLTKKVGVLERLTLTMLAASLAAWLLGAILHQVDIALLDSALTWRPLAIVFTVFAVAGIANATNIIDGYNGLAGGFAITVLAGLAYAAYQTADHFIFLSTFGLAGGLLGLLVWNWPKGKIFMGDGGAYLLGFMLAELSVLLVVRNPSVSPWFPLILLIYPVFETVFSIYRRKVRHGLSPGQPDNQHLHQLIHDYLVKKNVQTGKSFTRQQSNSRVAKYFWIAGASTTLLSCVFWTSTFALALCGLAFCMTYVAAYQYLIRRV